MPALELIYKQICARFAAPHPVTPGGGAGGADEAVPGRTGLFIASGGEPGQPRDRTNSLWPELFPSSPRPMPSPSQGSAFPKPRTRLGGARGWFGGRGGELVRAPRRSTSCSTPQRPRGKRLVGRRGRPRGGKGLELLFLNSGDSRF